MKSINLKKLILPNLPYASRISGQADKEAEDFITETLLKALFKFRFSRVSPPDTTE